MAKLVKAANVHAQAPVPAGQYGPAAYYIDIASETKVHLDLVISQGAISAVRLWFEPKPDFGGKYAEFNFGGLHAVIKGDRFFVEVEASWFLDWLVVNFFVPIGVLWKLGQSELPVDIVALCQVVIDYLKKQTPSKPGEPGLGDIVSAIRFREASGLVNASLLANKAANIAGADITPGSEVHLYGNAAPGENIKLSVVAAQASVAVGKEKDKNRLTAVGLETGVVDLSRQLNHVIFSKFRIDKLSLNGGVAPRSPKNQ